MIVVRAQDSRHCKFVLLPSTRSHIEAMSAFGATVEPEGSRNTMAFTRRIA